jgi:hypothetical protein
MRDLKEIFLKESNSSNIYRYPFWNVLIHEATRENAISISKHGFAVGKNPIIIAGIYTIPDVWKDGKFRDESVEFFVYTKKNIVVEDMETDKPSLQIGYKIQNPKYYSFFREFANDFGYSFEEKPKYNPETLAEMSRWGNDIPAREKYAKAMTKFLHENKVDVVVNGGECIIMNNNCIEKIESPKGVIPNIMWTSL